MISLVTTLLGQQRYSTDRTVHCHAHDVAWLLRDDMIHWFFVRAQSLSTLQMLQGKPLFPIVGPTRFRSQWRPQHSRATIPYPWSLLSGGSGCMSYQVRPENLHGIFHKDLCVPEGHHGYGCGVTNLDVACVGQRIVGLCKQKITYCQ